MEHANRSAAADRASAGAKSPERELLAWAMAVKHLHAAGMPAPVPPFPAAWLRRRGIRPDWVTAS
jgi:hypothetical protein